MSLKISLSGSALFRKSVFSFPYCKRSIISSLITFLHTNSTASQNLKPLLFSSTFSDHAKNGKRDTIEKWRRTAISNTLWSGRNTFTGDFPVEIRLSSSLACSRLVGVGSRSVGSRSTGSRSVGGYYQVRGVSGYPFVKVNYSENKHLTKVFDTEDI